MVSTEEIKKRKEQLEDALFHVNVALNHDEYKNPFKFQRMDRITPDHLKHSALKEICKKCEATGSGFDPNLITQHIERVALERFNKIALDAIEGQSIENLMAMRHEMELLMLNERKEHYLTEIAKSEKMLLESITKVPLEEVKADVVSIKPKKKK